MAVKTSFGPEELARILTGYDLGAYRHAGGIGQGTVQTNLLLETSEGRFVFRYYENRAWESVLFERDLLLYLGERDYPCPAPVPDRQGEYVGLYRDKPYVIFRFVEGHHVEHPGERHRAQLVRWAAELQKVTQGFHSPYTPHRWNYDPALCRRLARAEAARLDTPAAREKLAWLEHETAALELPPSLPRGICHCDFHFSNVLFHGDEFAALIDFDDANRTFLPFDLVGLIEAWAWPHTSDALDLAEARRVVQAYCEHRPLAPTEQWHLYDVYKLSILFDCVWFFSRWEGDGFYEKRKIEALAGLGRQAFFEALFGG
ncbi:MAG: homoserine kinase [Anaerolineae bacterium]